MIDGSEKRNRQLAFELQNSHVCEKCSNHLMLVFFFRACICHNLFSQITGRRRAWIKLEKAKLTC